MKKLFESRKVHASGTALPTPDIKIIFTKAPFVQYEQILLDKGHHGHCIVTSSDG